jgi:hypothetical protein
LIAEDIGIVIAAGMEIAIKVGTEKDTEKSTENMRVAIEDVPYWARKC